MTLHSFIKDCKPTKPELPIIHTCLGYDFRNILESKYIRPMKGRHFGGQYLAYFYYGRPAYKPSCDNKPKKPWLPVRLPVSFVIDYKTLRKPARIALFDTGAFDKLFKKNHFHSKMSIRDFLLEPSLDIPSHVVSKFFGTNNKYIKGIAKETLKIPSLEFEAQSYYNLITDNNFDHYDNRKLSIEIQINYSLSLVSSNVLLVVLPDSLLQDAEKIIINEFNAEVKSYPVDIADYDNNFRLLRSIINDYLIEKEFLV